MRESKRYIVLDVGQLIAMLEHAIQFALNGVCVGLQQVSSCEPVRVKERLVADKRLLADEPLDALNQLKSGIFNESMIPLLESSHSEAAVRC